MLKKVLLSGLLGWIVLVVWVFVSNGIFGFRSKMDMKQIPDEPKVYAVLKESIVEPGRYICNPGLTSSGTFPLSEPVFSIEYGGMGHEAAGRLFLIHLAVGFLAPTIAAWMLSVTSGRILSSYSRRVLFFAVIGLLFAVFGDLTRFGIGSYPLKDALVLAAYDIITWTLVGLAVAWRIQPAPSV